MRKENYIQLLIELSEAITRQPLPAWTLRQHWIALVRRFPDLDAYAFPTVSRECNFVADLRSARDFLNFVLKDLKKNISEL